ncbi:glycosyltransferase family 4 protein [Aidingimonas lacisalsi]|uniref:glycosyltransferase family 4 protein n=1 Tax=Aidingimonas lacisalsi TaxID=2604086 RepID=UPI0011D1C3BE|nr:glycosyltransferase family 4 protein [Aidingimonas lacisalsi]
MATSSLHIRHVNLARQFRGGERQTVLLMKALAEHSDVTQSLVCRRDSPMRDELSDDGIDFIDAGHQLAGHFSGPRTNVVHAHEAKAVHWAFVHSLLHDAPYLLTRRVPQPVKETVFNRWTYRRAACGVAISSVIEQHLRARRWSHVERIPSALSHLPHDPQGIDALRGRFAGRRVIGHIGALVDRHKGQRLLIEAARRLRADYPDVVFLLLGQGDDEVALKRESADLDNIVWEGFRHNIGDYLAIMDLFVFPSRNEGLGSTLLDVMDYDVPIIASHVDGIPDIVIDDETGILIPPNDVTALTNAIGSLLDQPGYGSRLAETARQRLSLFTPEAMADAYLSLYHRILTHDHRNTR